MSTVSFHFIGGKGGVGKTTCAAAIGAAAAAAGRRVLVVSTDPAPSLADALDITVTAAPRRVPLATGRLFAAEIDARASLRRWLDERRSVLEAIATEGTWLDREDVAALLTLSLPGVDELAALLEIAALARDPRFELVVVDTAPTGHTLRMLSMPAVLAGLASVFDTMREKRRVIQEALTGGWRAGDEDRLIGELAATAREVEGLLRNSHRTRTSWVTLPEPMAIAESADAIAALRSSGILVSRLIVNRLTPKPPDPCRHCDARRDFERQAVAALPEVDAVAAIRAREVEPRGLRALSSIAKDLERENLPAAMPSRQRRWRATIPGARTDPSTRWPAARLILLGGKGGVGKTTVAGALSAAVARRFPERRVLLISADPAHSLADVFGVPLTDAATRLPDGPPNLAVRELDPAAVFARFRDQYLAAVDQAFDRLRGGSSFDAAHDRSVMRRLIDLAPPGLDELAAILEITETFDRPGTPDELVVMDTAPTGHALRLLEMPALVHDWTRALMAILLKYQSILGVGQLGALLLDLSKKLRRLRERLADPEATAFLADPRPAALPRLETVRLVRRLEDLGIRVPAVVVNAVGRGTCAACVRIDRAQQREAAAVRRALTARPRRCTIIHTPAQVPAPHGAAALEAWSRTWRELAAVPSRTRGISSTS